VNKASISKRSIVLFLFSTAAISSAAHAADALAWKFKPGLTNRYRMKQETKVERTGAGGDATLESRMTLDMSWTVREVEADGSAVLEQTFTRMRMKMSTGAGQAAEIDSGSKEDPEGQAAMLAPLLKAVTSHSFTVTMTPRGEITEVNVPEALVEALKNQPGAAQMGELATEEGFEKLVRQAAFVLPEKLEPGTQWSSKTEASMPGIGTQTAETTYRYEGPKDVEGKTLEVFVPKVTIKFTGGEIPVEVARQESKGQILFNREAGRLESSHLKLDTEMKMTLGAEVATQTVEQTVDMKWLPEDAE